MGKEIIDLVEELKKYDNPKGYELEYEDVKKKLSPVIEDLKNKGELALDSLHKLLENGETWSSTFSLEILREIKSEKSIRPLIDYIVENEENYNGDWCETAMVALQNIGTPAIKPLIEENLKQFEEKKFYFFLTGALTKIKDGRVYEFMKKITEDYINNEEKYDGWFFIDSFTSDFPEQGNKEALSLLKKVLNLDRITQREKREIEDHIKFLEDPEGYKKRMKKEIEELKPIFEEMMKKERGTNEEETRKDINPEKMKEVMNKLEENIEIQFKCNKCNKKQNIDPGEIKIIGREGKEIFSFQNEIMCRSCQSQDIGITEKGTKDIFLHSISSSIMPEKQIIHLEDKVYVENKTVPFNESYDYILKRIKEEPENGGLYLRAGNIARRFNKYSEAIEHYKKSLEFNPGLIESYMNLVEIYAFRYKYYKIEGAKENAIFYLNEMRRLFNTQNFDTTTIKHQGILINFMGEMSELLDVYIPELIKVPKHKKKRKIGRNERCPCGSGKKYKKCCLDEDEI